MFRALPLCLMLLFLQFFQSLSSTPSFIPPPLPPGLLFLFLLESLLNRGFSKYRLKNSFNRFALNHHDVLDIKYSMEDTNEFIRSHFS